MVAQKEYFMGESTPVDGLSFEAALAELEGIVEKLERGDVR